MSNYTIYYQNWVFKHHTRKTLHNDKINNMLDCISTWQDWFRTHSNIERDAWRTSICSIGCWTEIHRLRRRGEELSQEVRCHKDDRAKFEFLYLEHLKAICQFVNYAAKLCICYLEGNFYSIQGVYVDDSIVSSISSASLVTEPAKRHLPQVGRLTQCREQQHWLQLRRRHQRASQKTPVVVHRFFNTENLLTNWKCRSCSHILWSWRTQKERSRVNSSWQTASLTLPIIPESLYYGLVKLKMPKVLTISLPQHLHSEPLFRTKILDFKIARGLRKIVTRRKLQETSHHRRRQRSIREEIIYGQSDWLDDPRWRQRSQQFIENHSKEQRSGFRHKSGTKYYRQSVTDWQHLGESVQDASGKVGKVEILVASLRARDNIRRQERPLLQIQVNGAKNILTTKSRIFVSKREIETRTDLHWELRAKEKRKEKAKTMRKTNPSEETGYVGSRMANAHLEICGYSIVTRPRKAEEMDDFFRLSDRHTAPKFERWRKWWWLRRCKMHQNLLVKVREGKRTDYFAETSREVVVRMEFRATLGRFPNVQNTNHLLDAASETSVSTKT